MQSCCLGTDAEFSRILLIKLCVVLVDEAVGYHDSRLLAVAIM